MDEPVIMNDIVNLLIERFGTKNNRHLEKNHWEFEIITGEGRSQVIHVFYKEIIHNQIDTSRIIVESPIGPLTKNLNYEAVLRKNSDLDVGTICIEDLRNSQNLVIPYLTLRATHLVPTADAIEILELAENVAKNADELEETIYARDIH